MNINLYKQAMEDIAVNPELVRETAIRMIGIASTEKQLHRRIIKRYAFFSGLAAIVTAALLLPGIVQDAPHTGRNPHIPSNSDGAAATDPDPGQDRKAEPDPYVTLPQITQYYEPYQPSDEISGKLKAPKLPFTYEELKQESQAVILVTVRDAGVYSKKDLPLHPKFSVNLANFLYTVQIDRVLSGSLPESEGDTVAVGEIAVAHLRSESAESENPMWEFVPYTLRPEAARTLEAGKQYVLFVAEKDDTDVYRLSWDGFGVFPMDYIAEEAANHSLRELQEQYRHVEEVTRAPMENDLLYRLCSLYIHEELL